MNVKAIRGTIVLHEDVMVEILLKLPVKSLLRFKSVCQRWRTIISSQVFIRSHYHRESNTTPVHLIYWQGRVRPPYFRYCPYSFAHERAWVFSWFSPDDETLIGHEDHSELIGPIMCMQGPCNGVFYVHYGNDSLALWNPATRMLRVVPHCPLQVSEVWLSQFGVDPLTGDLKIVSIEDEYENPSFAIYSVSDNSWSLCGDVDLVEDVHLVRETFGPTFCNGFCYWIKCKYSRSEEHAVVAFDIHNETFHEIEMPEFILESTVDRELLKLYFDEKRYFFNEENERELLPYILKKTIARKLDQYGDSLVLFTYHRLTSDGRVDMWLLKEHDGCWTKFSTLTLPFGALKDIGVWKMNQIFAVTSDMKLMIYDMDSGNTRNIEFDRKEEWVYDTVLSPFPYKESLVSF